MTRRDIQNTDFYNELTSEEQKTYFYQLRSKFVPSIDNIYYTVKIDDDENGNPRLMPLFKEIDRVKEMVRQTHEPAEFKDGLTVDF